MYLQKRGNGLGGPSTEAALCSDSEFRGNFPGGPHTSLRPVESIAVMNKPQNQFCSTNIEIR